MLSTPSLPLFLWSNGNTQMIKFQSLCTHSTGAIIPRVMGPWGCECSGLFSRACKSSHYWPLSYFLWLLCSFQLPQGDLDVLFSNIDDIIKVNSKFLQDLQETDSKEEEQVELIGKQKTRQQSALASYGVVLSMWSLLTCLQSSREMQLNGSLCLGSLNHSMSVMVRHSNNI